MYANNRQLLTGKPEKTKKAVNAHINYCTLFFNKAKSSLIFALRLCKFLTKFDADWAVVAAHDIGVDFGRFYFTF